jgi:hypothetical protein
MTVSEFVAALSDAARLAILSAVIIIVFILFAKTIKLILKMGVILVMLLLIAYFLRQHGII